MRDSGSSVDASINRGTHKRGEYARPSRAAWLFVYVFFSNGIPFDAPNRSEPCLAA